VFVAVIFAIIIIASIIFHFWSPWWWTPVASNWGNIDDTIVLSFWVTGAVFVAVCLFMAYCVWAYRYRPDRKAEYKPEDKKLEVRLTLITALGVAALLAPGLVTWNKYISVPKDAFKIEVLAYQWGWNFRLPGNDGALGTTSVSLISDENPYGLNPKDPNSKDDILVLDADLHLKIYHPVKVELRSLDVLHNFYIPHSEQKWICFQALSLIIGLLLKKKEISKFFVPSTVALTIMQCEDVFWWTRRKTIQIG